MNSKFLQKLGAICLGAAMTASSLSLGSTEPMTASAADTDNYAKLLQYSLYFYDCNMCGSDVETTGAISWRGNCHTGDEVLGGYHDAGDGAMFGGPQGFAASTIGWGYYEFKDSFDSLGVTTHFKTVSKHFTEFFKASTKLNGDTVTNFLYQKGNGNTDHDYWGKPENQEQVQGKRQMYWTSNSASDIAAEYAAALALDYLNFGDTESLTYAKALYKFSTQYNSIATDGPTGFYTNTSCVDEQAWAAGWLYLATKDEAYKNDCASKQVQYLGWVHGWETVALGAACVYAEITNDWTKVNNWISGQTTSNNYYCSDEWGSARLNCSMQMTALIASKHSSADYSAWCKNQMTYILGQNPKNTCFVTGFASNSAKNAHHRAASGYNNYDELGNNTTYSSNGHVLVGALVGGPSDTNGTYSDVINDYKCNEVAVDYNAGLVGAAAGLYSLYKTGSVDKTIEGVKDVVLGGGDVQTTTTSTSTATTTSMSTTSTSKSTTTTSGTTTTPAKDGVFELKVNQTYNYNDFGDDKMVGFAYEDFGLTAASKEKITKVEFNISTTNGNIKTWQGAFGSSTTDAANDYWTMTEQQEKTINSPSGTLTWDVDASTADIIQYGYGGEVKIGFWWIDCTTFTIDSVKIYTTGTAATTTTTSTTKTTTTTTSTTKTTTTTTSSTKTTTTTSSSTTTTTTPTGKQPGDLDCNGSVNISDAILAARYAAEDATVKISAQGVINADANDDGSISADDVVTILRMIAGLQ